MTRVDQAGTLIFFPDFGGNSLYARPLVRLLGGSISCFGTRFSADMVQSLETLSIEDVGKRFADDIQHAGFKRPIQFLGFSFASALAYETAQVMAQRNDAPDNVWVLDLPAPIKRRFRDVLRRPVFHLKLTYRFLRQHWRSVFFRNHDPMILYRYGVIGFDLKEHPESYRFIIRHLYAAYGKYVAKPSTFLITVLRARDNSPRWVVPDDLKWRAFSQGPVHAHVVPGDHLTMLRTPENAAVVAQHISDSFAAEIKEGRDDTGRH